jgi:antitoxin ParD1/3/4
VRFVDTLIASGAYESSGAVMRAALRALQARDAAMERWVLSQVVPMLGAMHQARPPGPPDDHVRTAVRRNEAVWLGEDR